MLIYELPKEEIYNLINPYLKDNQHIIDIDCDKVYNTIIIKIGMGWCHTADEDYDEYTKLIIIRSNGKLFGPAIFDTKELQEEVNNKLKKLITKYKISLEPV